MSQALRSAAGTAHPRVGGENHDPGSTRRPGLGSSPRGRGKLRRSDRRAPRRRLIPAWAGKTRSKRRRRITGAAHPRVGGENRWRRIVRISQSGSSPRGRGKPLRSGDRRAHLRLIPAWAGKTATPHTANSSAEAHPRVGGENAIIFPIVSAASGSSPRGRGKQTIQLAVGETRRLIPAWAGKTAVGSVIDWFKTAHPRVGGENNKVILESVVGGGSSPRGRGKRCAAPQRSRGFRLIPAWAGKTVAALLSANMKWAHPRVGGENVLTPHYFGRPAGSSPRGRGKHFLTCAFIKRIGQILETLELAVSSGSYSLCDVYATDAPQDQARNTGLALPSSRAAS